MTAEPAMCGLFYAYLSKKAAHKGSLLNTKPQPSNFLKLEIEQHA
jgi:hypothetical protein